LSSYPNPARDNITIQSENDVMKSVILFDIVGNQVAVFLPNSREMNINLSNFASGLYIAKISTLSGSGSLKLIIE
jgi:hypothetical protein